MGAREKAINSDYQLEALIIDDHGQQKHGAPRSSVFMVEIFIPPDLNSVILNQLNII